MAKLYYTLDETTVKLGCSVDQVRGLVKAGKLREFRDAGKVSYRVDEVDNLAAGAGDNVQLEDTGPELSIEDSGEIALAPEDSGFGGSLGLSGSTTSPAPAKEDPKAKSDTPIDLSGSDSGALILEDTSADDIKLDDSTPTGDAMSLDEVDKDAVAGMKKDDTVITNIGISVFDESDLEISADPMAKTVMAGGDEHLLDGSGAGSGLLDLTRESDDTSLGAELLEGIDMGETAETAASADTAAVQGADEEGITTPDMEGPLLVGVAPAVGWVEPASPLFTGLLIAASITLFLAGAVNMATSQDAWPSYLATLNEQFWIFLLGTAAVGGLAALIGWLVGRQATLARLPKAPKAKKAKKGKKGAVEEEPPVEEEDIEIDLGSDMLEKE